MYRRLAIIVLLAALVWFGCSSKKATEPVPPDIGASWRLVSSGISNTIRAIASNSTIALAVGDGGIVYSSTNARTWTRERENGPNDGLQNIVWFDSLFVAVGMNGTLVTSRDGNNWNWVGIEDQANMYGIAVGDTLAVAVGSGGSVYTSTDGVEWLLHRQDLSVNLSRYCLS